MLPKYANRLIDQIVDRFNKLFGEPIRSTKKVLAYHLNSNFEAVVEISGPLSKANIWIPFTEGKQPTPRFAIYYPAGKGRNSNTYPSPGLEKGLPALMLEIENEEALEEAIRYIRMVQ